MISNFKITFKVITANVVILVLASIFSCNCPEMPCVDPPCSPVDTLGNMNYPDSSIVWQHNGDTIANFNISMRPIVYGNTVLFSLGSSTTGDPFLFYNKRSGRLLNTVSVPKNPTFKSGWFHQYNKFCVITDWYYVYVLDLESNIQILRLNLKDLGYEGPPRLFGLGKFAYFAVNKLNIPDNEYGNTWIRLNIETLEFEEVVSIQDIGTFTAKFESLGFFFKPDGDTVMIFQNRQYNIPNQSLKTDMYAYNINAKKFEWKIDSITTDGSSSLFPVLVKADKFYFQGTNEVFCFNCIDGKLIWKRSFQTEEFLKTNAILAEGKYIIKCESLLMVALDENSGLTIWENHDSGSSSSNMIYNKGSLFYETNQKGVGVIKKMRVTDGKIFWTYFSPNFPKYINSSYKYTGLTIDSETNYLYCNDQVYNMCVRLPK